jgi:phosphatidylinositol alpha-1,6-mannosyltransferase
MRILVVTNDFPPRVGGVNYYVDQILRRFPPGEVTVFASSWPGAAEFDAGYPHPVVRWPSRLMLSTPRVQDRVVELVRAERPDVVLFGASFPLALMGPKIERRTGVPFAGFTHGVEVGVARIPGGRRLLRAIGRNAALLTAVSGWSRDVLRPAFGPTARLELLLPGIDGKRFHPGVSDQPVRDRHGLDGYPVVCCVSRLVARKGQDQVIRALPRIARAVPEVRFLVVGSGPHEASLRRLVQRVGVTDRVVFTGQVAYEELPMHFRAGNVFAMPCRSRYGGLEVEALGVVFLQAAAVGRPSVAGDSGGAPEAVRGGETGLVMDGRNVDAVAEAIVSLLSDPERAEAMGAAGADWVHRELTWEAVVERLQKLLVDAVGRPRGPARFDGRFEAGFGDGFDEGRQPRPT